MRRPYHVRVLIREMEKRKAKNSRYSLRAFAQFLDLAPSTLSRILTSSQELSVTTTKKIIKRLELSEEEQFFFIASVAEEKKFRTLQTLEKIPGQRTEGFRFTLESIADLAMRGFSDGCIIHLKDHRDESILHAKHKYGHYTGGHFDVLRTPVVCHPLLSPDQPVFLHLEGEHDDLLGHLNAHSVLALPVSKGASKYGAITFIRTNGRECFSEKDLLPAKELSLKTAIVYHLLVDV